MNNLASAWKSGLLSKIFILLSVLLCALLKGSAFAAGSNLGNVASSITSTLTSVSKAVTGVCYVAGLAFSVTGILKFKQHKDNPTQVTIGAPISMVLIAAALLFLPSILDVAGYTMFGSTGGTVSGPGGAVFGSTGGGS